MYVLSCSVLSNAATPLTVACQVPLSLKFCGQGYWSELPFPPPGDLPNPGIEPAFPESPVLQWILYLEPLGKTTTFYYNQLEKKKKKTTAQTENFQQELHAKLRA